MEGAEGVIARDSVSKLGWSEMGVYQNPVEHTIFFAIIFAKFIPVVNNAKSFTV